MRTLKQLALALIGCSALIGPAYAQALERQPDGGVTWQAGVDGATLEFNPDGTVKRIYSKYTQPVTIADRRGIQTATIIAEEKAKANIVRFLDQHVASSRIVSEFQNEAAKTTSEGDNIATTTQRAIGTSLTELTSSFSSGTLTGVVVLEDGFDDKKHEAWVVVGLSQKTMAAARATKDMLFESQRPGPRGATTTTPVAEPPRTVIRRGNSDF